MVNRSSWNVGQEIADQQRAKVMAVAEQIRSLKPYAQRYSEALIQIRAERIEKEARAAAQIAYAAAAARGNAQAMPPKPTPGILPDAPLSAPVAPVPETQETPWHLLATPAQLIAAFGTFTGMSADWFNHVKSTPRLLAARVHKGQGGKNYREPLYNIMMVLTWLTEPQRKGSKVKRIQPDTAWRILKNRFPKVYEEFQDQAPDPD